MTSSGGLGGHPERHLGRVSSPARPPARVSRTPGGRGPFMLLTAAWPPGAEGSALPAPAPRPAPRARPRSEGPTATTVGGAPGWAAGSAVGSCVSDFALAPLRGLDVQTSPERAEREGPARGRRRREAPPLKGAGRVPPLGRTRGRKGPGRGCERPQGGQPRAGLRFGPPRRGRRWRAGGRRPPGRGRRQRQAGDPAPRSVAAGGSSPPPRAAGGESESEPAARTLRPGRGVARGEAGWAARAAVRRPTRPAGRARRRNSPAPP